MDLLVRESFLTTTLREYTCVRNTFPYINTNNTSKSALLNEGDT